MKYEAHITIEPVVGERLEKLKALCQTSGFRVAELLMLKPGADRLEMHGENATMTRSAFDTFATGKSDSHAELFKRAILLAAAMHRAGYRIWRLKIEEILYDIREDASGDIIRNVYSSKHFPSLG